MSIIGNVEKYMKRYDYLIEKQQRKCKEGKTLSKEEHDELRKLRPNVFTPILMMFELLHDTVKSNQVHRQQSARVKSVINQTGGTQPTTMNIEEQSHNNNSETKRLSELEESLLPLLTKIIMYIELNKKKNKGKAGSDGEGDGEEEDEKYPDIGTSAKNSAILVVRRIKKWWNDLIAGGTSDISSKINLKKAIPQLPNNPDDMNNLHKMNEMNEIVDKATDAIHNPLQKIEKILSNDVRDIASSSVEGIMNALSLIPGIGTTLQLWRLLQNVIVIMSKSVSTMADTKTVGGDLKNNVQGLKADFEKMANPEAIAAAATKELSSHIPGGGAGGGAGAAAANLSGMAQQALGGGAGEAASKLSGMAQQALGGGAGEAASKLSGMAQQALGGGANAAVANLSGMAQQALAKQQGGANERHHKTNHIRSIKKYKREYKQSLREIQKTRKNILRLIKKMI